MTAGVRMTKPWRRLCADEVESLGGHLGVYEIATPEGEVVFIGYAGGHARFGLGGELGRQLAERGDGTFVFRVEVTMAYLSRWRELLMAHRADHGRLPSENDGDGAGLGRLSPA